MSKYHSVSRFIGELCVTNDGDEFLTSFKKYPSQGVRTQSQTPRKPCFIFGSWH